MRKKTKKVLAYVLALALMFSNFVGLDLTAKAAENCSVTEVSVTESSVPAENAEVTVNIKGTNLPTQESDRPALSLVYQVRETVMMNEREVWCPLKGYETPVEILSSSSTGGTIKISLPDNTTEEAKKLQVRFQGKNDSKFVASNSFSQEGKKGSTPEPPVPGGQVLSDEKTFRAKVVDENQKPLSGINFSVNAVTSENIVTTNARGVLEYALKNQTDFDAKFTVKVEDASYTSKPATATFETDADTSRAQIWKVNGVLLEKAGEVVFTLTKVGGEQDSVDKTELRAEIGNATKLEQGNYTEETWNDLQTALTKAQEVEADGQATKDAVEAATKALKDAIGGLVSSKEIIIKVVDETRKPVQGVQFEFKPNDSANKKPEVKPTDESGQTVISLEGCGGFYTLTAVESEEYTFEAPADKMEYMILSGKIYKAPVKGAVVYKAVEKGGVTPPPSEQVDKTALRAEIANAKKLVKDDYTAETWNALQIALTKAQEVEADEQATKEKVETATEALKKAIADLKPAETKKVKVTSVSTKATTAPATGAVVEVEIEGTSLPTEPSQSLLYQVLGNVSGTDFWMPLTDYTKGKEIASPSETGGTVAVELPDNTTTKARKLKIRFKGADNTKWETEGATVTGEIEQAAPGSEKPESVDKTELKAEIAKTADLVKKYYTTETWNALQAALTEAKNVDANEKATKEEVATATEKLKTAIEGLQLVLADENDKEELRAKHDELKAINANPKYTVNSRKDLAGPVAYARYVLNEENATIKDVEEALKTLKDAESKLDLKLVTGVTKLTIKLVDAEGVAVNKVVKLVKDDVQYNTQENLLAANGSASFVLTGWESKNAENDFEIYLPADAEYIATPAVLKIDLENEDGSSVFNTVNGKPVGDGVVEMKLEEKSKDACDKTTFRAYAHDEEGNPLEGIKFDAKYADLMDPVLVSDENGMISYEVTSWDKDSKIVVSLQDGQGYYSNEKFEFEVIEDPEESTRAIISEINGEPLKVGEKLIFTVRAVNKTALEEKVADAKAIKKGNFTDDSWKALQDAIAEAEEVLKDEKADQTAVDAQVEALTTAIEGLTENKPVVNKAALEKAVAKAKAIEKGNFTDDSWKALQDAIAEAEGVLKDEKATQTTVDAQVEALTKAVEGLTEKEPENPDPEKPNPEKPDPEKPDPEKPDPEKPNPEKPNPEKPGSQNVVFDKANGRSIRFNTGIKFEDLDKVIINGKVVDASNFTVKKSEDGKAIVILKGSYLGKLANGNYTVEVVSEDGTTESGTLVVKGKVPADKKPESTVPKTGDVAHPLVYVIGMFATVGVCVFTYRRKRTF